MPRLPVAVLTFVLLANAALAAGREIAAPPLGPSAYPQRTITVAYAGGRYLTVWIEQLGHARFRHLGAFSDHNGNRISPSAFVIVADGVWGAAKLIGTGDGFTLFAPQADGLRMLDIDLAERVTANRLVPVERFDSSLPVAWNGSHFAIVDGARLLFLDRAGAIARSVDLPCRPLYQSVAAVRSDVIVARVCGAGSALYIDVVRAGGSVVTTMLDDPTPQPGVRFAAAPAAGGATLVVWGAGFELESAILAPDGTLSPKQPVFDHGSHTVEPLALAKTADGFLLADLAFSRLHTVTLDEDGARRPGGSVAPETDFGRPASAATDGTHILVADIQYEAQSSLGRARTRLVSPDAEIGAAEALSIIPARQLAPVLAAGSGSLVAAWTELQGMQAAVKAAQLAADGTPLASHVIDPNASLASKDLAWNGAEYLAVILRNGQLRAQRISAFGERAGSPALLYDFPDNRTPRVAVVWADDQWVVSGTDSVIAFHATVDADGKRTAWSQLPLAGILDDETASRTGIYDVALAYDGDTMHVAWIEGQVVPCQVLCIESRPAFAATIDRFGLAVSAPRRIGDAWDINESVSLAAGGDGVIAITNVYGDRAIATAHDGAMRAFDGTGDVTWDGTSFVLALRERDRLTLRRLGANLREAARPRVAGIAPADTAESEPSVAVAIPGNAIVGLQESDANSGGRAVAFAEQELGHEPQRRRAVRR